MLSDSCLGLTDSRELLETPEADVSGILEGGLLNVQNVQYADEEGEEEQVKPSVQIHSANYHTELQLTESFSSHKLTNLNQRFPTFLVNLVFQKIQNAL